MANTPARSVRVSNPLWEYALRKANWAGTTISTLVNALLTGYLGYEQTGRFVVLVIDTANEDELKRLGEMIVDADMYETDMVTNGRVSRASEAFVESLRGL